MERAQGILLHLAELMHREREAIATESENTLLAIDHEIELAVGEKERAMGALRQHRQDHGC
jgi:hypothetical protein